MLLRHREMEVAQEACSKEGKFSFSGAAGSSCWEPWSKGQTKQQEHSIGSTLKLLKRASKCGARFLVWQNEENFLRNTNRPCTDKCSPRKPLSCWNEGEAGYKNLCCSGTLGKVSLLFLFCPTSQSEFSVL